MPMRGTELLIILTIMLLFFGATRVPQLGRSLGQRMQEFRKGDSEDAGTS
jgi:sec-independent protein translocase protein TatA